MPLEGLTVLDLSRVLAGPYCTMLLADLGADVVKVERPGSGDETRGWGPPDAGGESAYYLSVNRSKRSVAIDLAQPRGRDIVLALARRADVVIENFKAGGADKLGVGYDDLRRVNPSVVCCSITGFGSRRSPADRTGYDFVVQAESGYMAITGGTDEPPAKVGVAVVDLLAGLQATVAILAAVRRRERAGAHVEVSLLDSALASLVNVASNVLVGGGDAQRLGNAHPNIVPYEPFRTSDGWIAVAAANDRSFARLCEMLGCEELATDQRFATNAARVGHRLELIPLLADRFAARTSEDWLAELLARGIPAGVIRGVRDALAAAAVAGDPATVTVAHPTAGTVELVRSAIRATGMSLREPEPPPLLGEHTREVLLELGMTEAVIRSLEEDAVVGVPPGSG